MSPICRNLKLILVIVGLSCALLYQILGEPLFIRILNDGVLLFSNEYEDVTNWDGQRRLMAVDLPDRVLSGLDLAGADLSYADLKGADLSGTNLRRANLDRVILVAAKLDGTNLEGARYDRGTRWPVGFYYQHSGAVGPEADLTEADLSLANLDTIDLIGANLDGTDLVATRYNSDTIWPDTFNPEAANAVLVDERGNPIK